MHGQKAPRVKGNLADPPGGYNVGLSDDLCIHTIDFQTAEPYSLPVSCAVHGDDGISSARADRAATKKGETAMTTFDKREDAAEKKFAHDAELQFKATARRNKLLGLWVAEKIGKSGAEAEEYAKEVVRSDFEEAGDDDVFRKIRKDLDAAKVDVTDHVVRRTMDELMAKAIEAIKSGG